MRALKRYKYHLVAALILLALLFVGAKTKLGTVTKTADELPHVGSAFQMNHALELFPSAQSSFALNVAGGGDMRGLILALVKQSVPSKYEDKSFEIARAVIVEANHHRMDPLFLLAVIATESRFNLDARGTHGEIGLMQVLPVTAKWLAPQAGLRADFDLREPAVNIRLGATYLARLRATFKHRGNRYIAAYNMGVTNVYRLLKVKTEPNVYPARVLGNYSQIYFALGSKVTQVASRDVASVK
ncbi:MAG: lytic transglycosylase domain-containing protein [Bdellovibrionales bacterium]